ncbi:hypothetical protein VNO80_30357 [Phaseolus coccineus]|uniref:Uncharacterized protein n=1 Tax=Phaseolus coccineus TaxID=3886 RepID=A0AAN9LCP1_PHACN
MASITNSNSTNVPICPKEEEFETPPSKITDSVTNDEPIAATPISFYPPDHYHIEYHNMVDRPTNMTETPSETPSATPSATQSATQNSSSKKGRRPKAIPEWIGNWDVDSRKRPHSNRFDKTYRHKEQGFLCRSLLECERYEKHGIRPQRRGKTKEKEENSNKPKNDNKPKNENKEIVPDKEKNQEAELTEEALVAQRREKAESMKGIVEEFLAEAHYNQLHMFNR